MGTGAAASVTSFSRGQHEQLERLKTLPKMDFLHLLGQKMELKMAIIFQHHPYTVAAAIDHLYFINSWIVYIRYTVKTHLILSSIAVSSKDYFIIIIRVNMEPLFVIPNVNYSKLTKCKRARFQYGTISILDQRSF